MTMNAGTLVDTIRSAVMAHGATPLTEIIVRIGETGHCYNISKVKAQAEGHQLRLILETNMLPDLTRG